MSLGKGLGDGGHCRSDSRPFLGKRTWLCLEGFEDCEAISLDGLEMLIDRLPKAVFRA